MLHLDRLQEHIEDIDEDSILLSMDKDVNASDVRQEREKIYEETQVKLDRMGLTRVAVKTISHGTNAEVRRMALKVVHSLMNTGNSSVQLSINSILTTEETDGAFFFKVRELIQVAGDDMKEYRKVKKMNESRSNLLVGNVLSCIEIFQMLQQLCEGHQR